MGGISPPGVVNGRHDRSLPRGRRTAPLQIDTDSAGQSLARWSRDRRGRAVEGRGGRRWSGVGTAREAAAGPPVIEAWSGVGVSRTIGRRGPHDPAGSVVGVSRTIGRHSPHDRRGASWGATAPSVATTRGAGGERGGERPIDRSGRRKKPRLEEPGLHRRSGAGQGSDGSGDRDRGPARAALGDGQRRGSSPARFSQRSSILRMKEPPSPVPGAVGPLPPPGPPPEVPVPEEVPLGPVIA